MPTELQVSQRRAKTSRTAIKVEMKPADDVTFASDQVWPSGEGGGRLIRTKQNDNREYLAIKALIVEHDFATKVQFRAPGCPTNVPAGQAHSPIGFEL